MDPARYRALFVEEATEHLGEMRRALLELEKDPSASAALEVCFRMAHSIKGMAAAMRLPPITARAHALEEILERARGDGRVDPVEALPDLFSGVAEIERLVSAKDDTESPAPALRAGPPAQSAARLVQAFRPPASLRVRAETLDRLLAGVGEVALASSRLRAAAAGAEPSDPLRIASGLDRMDRVLGDLERRALELRTAPLLRVTEALPGLARDLGIALGKRVSLELGGVSLALDRSILDRLGDPLLHLVRNAIAHGIETPAERRLRGKPETGSIRVEARRENDAIEIAVIDDGAGLDVATLRRKAVAAGLVPADLADDLPPGEIARLAFHPGLSTAAAVSEIAGRGVGLDAVRTAIGSLGGRVDLLSEPGRGTTALVRVPLSAAVQRVILVGVGDEAVGVPIGRVDRIDEVDAGAIEHAGSDAFVPIDGLPLPLFDLASLLSITPAPPRPRVLVLLAEVRGQRIALRFDRLLGQQEAFVKPVPTLLAGLGVLCGLTFAPDGRPVFLIDPARLL